jgi:hypothetical protein
MLSSLVCATKAVRELIKRRQHVREDEEGGALGENN